MLGGVFLPWDALLNAQTVSKMLIYNLETKNPLKTVNLLPGVDEVDDEGADGEDEDEHHQDLAHAGLGRDELPSPVLPSSPS